MEKGFFGKVAGKLWPDGSSAELKMTVRMSWALIITQTAELLFQPVAVMFGGHLGKIELDAISLANMLINVLGLSVIMGLVSCCETVFSQAYGHGNPKMIGVYLQRAFFIFLFALLVCFSIHLNVETILVCLSQDPEVSRMSGQYMLYFMPGMFAIAVTIVLRRYTQCQGSVTPHLVFMLIGHVIHTTCQYLFLYQFNLGILGSAMAQNAAFIFIGIATVIYTLCSKEHRQAWGGFDIRALEEWGPLAKLAIFGLLMCCFEWWAFEVTVIVAGILGVTDQAVQGILINLNNIYYGIPYGIAVAACIRVGQHVGANEPYRASVATHVGIILTGSATTILTVTFAALQVELPKLFTNDLEVMRMATDIIPVFCMFMFFSGINIIGRGVFRGIGWQFQGALLSFLAFYVLSWPISLPLVFLTPVGLKGLWIGLAVAVGVLAPVYLFMLYFKVNWEKLCDESKQREYDQKRGVSVSGWDKLEAQPPVSERTSLLHGSMTRSMTMSCSLTHSLTVAATKEIHHPDYTWHVEDTKPNITKTLILQRIATCAVFIFIFVAALIARLLTDTLKEDYTMAEPRLANVTLALTDLVNGTGIMAY